MQSVRMDEENVKNIQKFLVAQLNFTPRRKMFEDHLLEKESEKLRKFEILSDDDEDDEDSKFIETTEPSEQRNQWKLIKQLRDFRRTHIKECVNPLNRQKYMRAEQRDEEFLSTSSHRMSGPPSTEELINLIENDKKKESIRARFNACKFRQ